MARQLRSSCGGCDFLGETERRVPEGYKCWHPAHGFGLGREIGPRPETPEWCPLENSPSGGWGRG